MSADADRVAGQAGANAGGSWGGVWVGVFGARTDLTLTITAMDEAEILLLGHPVAVSTCVITGETVAVSGSGVSVTLQRVDATSAQGVYVNGSGAKATALFRLISPR